MDACPSTEKKFYVTDNVLTQNHISLIPEFWGSFSYNPTYINRAPDKLFNCFIRRVCIFRQSWFYQLVRRNLLDVGNVSYLLDYREKVPGIENKQQLNEYIFQQGNHIFEIEHVAMKNSVPYRNFDTDLDQAIVDSKIGVVIETYFHDNTVIAFSEKVFRNLQLPRPFMLFSSPGAIGILRKYGFKLYDELVDHNYDQDNNPITRQIKILNQIEKFKTVEYSESDLKTFEHRALHNQQLLKDLKNAWPNKFEEVKKQIKQYTEI